MKSYRVQTHRLAVALVAVLVVTASLHAQTTRSRTVRVTLLQVNDVYQLSPVDRGANGGLARLATLRKRVLAESPNTLFLLSGDTLSPSVASTIFKGEQMVAGWNAVGLDYAALGNHEFDFGDDVLLARMKASRFTWLAANVVDRRTGRPFGDMPPYVIRNFDGVKVGVFGILTPDTAQSSKPSRNVKFLDPDKTAARITRQLRARGATVIVAVTHLSMPEDKRLARAARVDVIIGGHEHEVMQSQAGCATIFKMGSDARLMGRIDLNISRATRRVESIDYAALPVTDKVPDDPQALAVINEYEKKLSAELDKPVGQTSVELDARQKTNRTRESNLGSFVADAFRRATDADIAIINGGGIRSNSVYPVGPLTRRDVLSILPFEDPVAKVEVTGATVRAALEHGVARVVEDPESGRFPQVSGLEFTYDARKPPGARVVEVRVGGQPLDYAKMYTVAAVEYLLDGGDGYTMFRGARYVIKPEEGKVNAVILGDAILAVGTIAPQTDGRIRRIDEPTP
jgi:5'-nucleotidase